MILFNQPSLEKIKEALLKAKADGREVVTCLCDDMERKFLLSKYGIEWIKNASGTQLRDHLI